MKPVRQNAKNLLRQVLEQRLALSPYVSVVDARHDLVQAGGKVQPATLKRYLHELTKARFISGSGRGWYSSLSSPFVLQTQPVSELAVLLQKQFRFLRFACWSTDQVKPFMHHLLTRDIQFVSAESHTLVSLGEFLESRGFAVFVNPTKTEARRFVHLKERTLVLRPSHTKEPAGHPFARIEKILVDLRVEVNCLNLMDIREFQLLANAVIRQGRVQVATLIRYAEARLLAVEDMFGNEESTNAKL